MIKFNEQVKSCRKKSGKTQREIANILGISEHTYQSYELGTHEPNFGNLTKLAKYFDVPIDYLLGYALFQDWETMNEHWDFFINQVSRLEPFGAILKEFGGNRIYIVELLAVVIDHVKFDEETNTLIIYWKLDLEQLTPKSL